MGVLKLAKKDEVILQLADRELGFPVIEGSEGELGINIAKLRGETGCVVLDHGFVNTASCESKITYLDGEKGILRYRGYAIEDLAENTKFMDVSYLLMYGNLPSAEQAQSFKAELAKNSDPAESLIKMASACPKAMHPMGLISSLLLGLSSSKPEYLVQDLDESSIRGAMVHISAQMKNIAAMAFRVVNGLEIVKPDPSKSYCADFYQQMFKGTPWESLSPSVEAALNTLLILHADHEQNCSTSSVRLVGSSRANPYASISAGVNALWGPLHGGANEAVIAMLGQIEAGGGDYKEFIQRAKDKNDPFKLMGFGHRVYKNFDPRAKIIKKSCDTVLSELGVNDPLLDIAKGLEHEALNDSYFVDRKLYPNVDFYSGIIYKALNIPPNMYTVMFALGRLPGWLAQWKEMLETPETKIGRPRQIYQGPKLRKTSDK